MLLYHSWLELGSVSLLKVPETYSTSEKVPATETGVGQKGNRRLVEGSGHR